MTSSSSFNSFSGSSESEGINDIGALLGFVDPHDINVDDDGAGHVTAFSLELFLF